jgi:glycosyltransferase involved in cell wall biosynthesis
MEHWSRRNCTDVSYRRTWTASTPLERQTRPIACLLGTFQHTPLASFNHVYGLWPQKHERRRGVNGVELTSDTDRENPTTTKVTIFVASINTAAATELCVRSIARYTERDSYVLCVGDCGSTDNSLPRLMQLLHDNVIDEVMLAAHGRSHGAWLDLWTDTCATPYAAMVDSDIEILEPKWLDKLLKVAYDSDAAIVCAEIVQEVPQYIDHTGVPRRLARRPSAWMMLLDVAKCRGRASWQFAMEDDLTIPEGQWGLDTGALLMRALNESGEQVVTAPPSFQRSFRHYGGLSWIKMTRAKGWRYRASLLKVRLLGLYVFARLRWVKTQGTRGRF